MALPVIQLRVARASAHPWIWSKMVRHPKSRPKPGSIVEIVSKSGDFAGRGFYHPSQTIAVRILTEDPAEAVDAAFFEKRLRNAREFREGALGLLSNSDSYRLVHAEGDGLSGIVIDKFADVFVVEPFCAGGAAAAGMIVEALKAVFPGGRVAFRVSPRTEEREPADYRGPKERYPLPPSVWILEEGVRMLVDFSSLHKTGHFLDQRENRAAAGRLAAGRIVFDLFCCTGGFSIHAFKGGAREIVAVDLDERALATAAENARAAGAAGRINFVHQDAFDFLRARIAEGARADLVIVDPAKFAGVKDEVPRALKTYGDINRLAISVLRPGGLLVTCSCSGLVSEEKFRSVVSRSAAEAGAALQLFRVTGAAPDHPVSTSFPEGRYLKVLWGRVQAGRPPVISNGPSAPSKSCS